MHKLLDMKGVAGVEDIKRRINSGSGIQVRGLNFTPALLEEAVAAWLERQDAQRPVHSAQAAAPPTAAGCTPKAPAPADTADLGVHGGGARDAETRTGQHQQEFLSGRNLLKRRARPAAEELSPPSSAPGEAAGRASRMRQLIEDDDLETPGASPSMVAPSASRFAGAAGRGAEVETTWSAHNLRRLSPAAHPATPATAATPSASSTAGSWRPSLGGSLIGAVSEMRRQRDAQAQGTSMGMSMGTPTGSAAFSPSPFTSHLYSGGSAPSAGPRSSPSSGLGGDGGFAQKLRTFCDASRQRLLGATNGSSSTGGPVATPCRTSLGEPSLQRRRLSYSGDDGAAAADPASEILGQRSVASAYASLRAPHSRSGAGGPADGDSGAGRAESPVALRRKRASPASLSPPPRRGDARHSDVEFDSRDPAVRPPSPLRTPSPPQQQGSSAAGSGSGRASASASSADGVTPDKAPSPSGSVRELKAWLADRLIDFAGCVEKAELQALWSQFNFLRTQPLEILQNACVAGGGHHFGSTDECARFLTAATSSRAPPSRPRRREPEPEADTPPPPCARAASAPAAAAPATAPAAAAAVPPPTAQASSSTSTAVVQSVEADISRILRLRRETFTSSASWGAAVLVVPAKFDTPAVQKGFRNLMKRLHPDKVGAFPSAARAVELVREAREVCERSLLRLSLPRVPSGLSSAPLCADVGRRQILLTWDPPRENPAAPVRRYVVAAVDPAYGRALTIRTLEPDYDQELHRFVSISELTSFVLAEEELQKMPSLWQQSHATLKIAAMNEAGQSEWATISVPLRHMQKAAAAGPGRPRSVAVGASPSGSDATQAGLDGPASASDDEDEDFEDVGSSAGDSPPSYFRPRRAAPGAGGRRASSAGVGRRTSRAGGAGGGAGGAAGGSVGGGAVGGDTWSSSWNFEMELRHRRGLELRAWLSRHTKAPLANWLRSLRYPSSGTKEELVERIYRLQEQGALDPDGP